MDDLNINIFNLLIFSGVIYGIFFSVTILTNKKYRTNNTMYLALVVLFLSLSNLQYWFIDSNVIQNHNWLRFTYVPIQWLILPMFYSYVCAFIGRKLSFKNIFLLCTPFLIVFLIITGQNGYKFFIDTTYNLPSHFESGLFTYLEVVSILFNVVLILLSYKRISTYEKTDLETLSLVKAQTNWLKRLIYVGLIVCFSWLIAIITVITMQINTAVLFYPIWLIMSLLIYWIGYTGINNSLELKERISLRVKKIIENTAKPIFLDEENATYTKIVQLITHEKLHLKTKVSLKDIAQELHISEGYVSQLINTHSNVNFNEFINALRVSDAKAMLENTDFNHYTLESIGLESGFNSKSNFYAVFKKHLHKTPLQYKKEVQDL